MPITKSATGYAPSDEPRFGHTDPAPPRPGASSSRIPIASNPGASGMRSMVGSRPIGKDRAMASGMGRKVGLMRKRRPMKPGAEGGNLSRIFGGRG